MTHRGTVHANDRGSAADRRTRREWLMQTFGVDGIAVCWRCDVPLLIDEITVDRYPIPGCQGGRYVRGNIRPACGQCNSEAGGRTRRTSVQPTVPALGHGSGVARLDTRPPASRGSARRGAASPRRSSAA